MDGTFLQQAIIYLAAAILCVPLAKRLGMGSVLGYLLAGILIGPFVFGFVGSEGKDIMHVAEFGVVMMLFLVGLELEPAKFWRMRRMIGGMGFLQVCGTAALIFAGALLFGLSWQVALTLGLTLAMSSTAIVLQSLKEKGLLQTSAGQGSFAVLLFQDIAVIPILALLPLLAVAPIAHTDASHHTILEGLPGWTQTLVVLGAIGAVVVAGRFVVVPLLRVVAKTHLRELFTASSLLIVVGIAYLMQLVGLSPALGTFLAGVVLANSEYRHELEGDIEPFKGLLLGLFFIAVGASIDFQLIGENPGGIVALVLGVMALKGLVLAGIGKMFGMKLDQNMLFALGLSQVGEFAFVLLSFTGQLGIMDADSNATWMAVTAMSMTVTPLLFLVYDKAIKPRFGTKEKETQDADAMDEHNPVIIAGYSHFGSTIGRFLRANGVQTTVLDNNSDNVDVLRKLGHKVFYGDATRVDLLKSAGAEEAKILVIATGTPETNIELVKTVAKHFPHLRVLVRAKNRFDAYELVDIGQDDIYRDSLDTAVRLGVDVLHHLGFRAYTATRSGQNFRRYDEIAMRRLAVARKDAKQYISSVRSEVA
ncbi:MAG TPA: monovalent cation:proton antiporter-2 (CPA2) family protein, partial [Chitinophagales bacterium]|nr:monovalent cation:proton antiporter-2 (CPA2) family protein [Chitinophagales bacterium]